MTELLTSAQMRAIEAAAIAGGTVTGLTLMARAGQGAVDAIFAEWPELAMAAGDEKPAPCAVVLCGPGNNGGDGFVVARLLRDAGWLVEVYFAGEADKLPPDARANYERWIAQDKVFGEIAALSGMWDIFCAADLVIDAVFGIGLSRPISQYWREIIDKMDQGRPRTKAVAIDIPSGFDADTGKIVDFDDAQLEEWMSYTDAQLIANFDMTVTFHRKKHGHVVPECLEKCGKVVVVDIGL